LSSHGPSHVSGKNREAVVCVIYYRLSLPVQRVLFFLQGSLGEPCLPLAGSVPISQEALDIAVFMLRTSSTASVSHTAQEYGARKP
jgi:hypothetical protein